VKSSGGIYSAASASAGGEEPLEQEAPSRAAAVAQTALHTTLSVYAAMLTRSPPTDRASLKQVRSHSWRRRHCTRR
jgi:hypothetical protein